MKRISLLLPTLAAAGLLNVMGCNASGTVAVGASAAPNASASSGTSANASVGANASVNTGALNTTLAAIYKQGRTWTYERTTGSGSPVDYTQKVTAVSGNTATVVQSQSGQPDTTLTIDLTQKDLVTAMAASGVQYTYDTSGITQESITVPAGTYTANHLKGTFIASATGATVNGTFEDWYDNAVGLVKNVTSISVNAAMPTSMPSLPPGVTLPPGVSMPGTSASASAQTTTTVLKSVSG